MGLYPFQKDVLDKTNDRKRIALYWEMGLGKTYAGAEKMIRLGARVNLVVCQKSKVDDWIDHVRKVHDGQTIPFDLTCKKEYDDFFDFYKHDFPSITGVINYDLIFRRPELLELKHATLLLDESSLIQNPEAKRTMSIMSMNPDNVILLSGTPTGGKYERLVSQMNLLGWDISEKEFYDRFVNWHWKDTKDGFWYRVIESYKNEDELKRLMREYGCSFLKTDEVFDLPDKIEQTINVENSKEYKNFRKNHYIEIDGDELQGDTVLKKMLYERQLCGQYQKDKLAAFADILDSTEDRLIVFYNFTAELEKMLEICKKKKRAVSVINGQKKDLKAYESDPASVTLIQYQAGAMGLNLQKSNKIIYFTPPLSSELFEQSKKRIHRIGQNRTCFYYYLTCKGSIEDKIYKTLAMRRDYTEKLFAEEEGE